MLGVVGQLALHAQERGPAPELGPTNTLRLEWVLRQVLVRNASLRSAQATWRAMDLRTGQVAAWSDTVVGVDVERDNTAFADYHDTEWMVTQEIPISGKNRQRARMAAADAMAARADVRSGELALVAQARGAFYRYANAHQQLEIIARTQTLLGQIADISRNKFEVGKRTRADVLMAETELAKILEARRDLEQLASEEQTRLNTLMNFPPKTPLPAPEPEKYQEHTFDLAQLQREAMEHRPELTGAQKRLEAARAQITLAKRSWIPDPELRVEARQFDGQGGGFQEYDTGIFFRIPWLNQGKYRGAIAEAREQAQSVEDALEAARLETMGKIANQVQRIETLRHHYHVFGERIVPLARQSIEAVLSAYTSDQATVVEVLSAQRSLQDAEATLQHHLTEYLNALAELEPLVGRPLEPIKINPIKP